MARDFGIKPNEGAIINQVLAGSPAEKAGVEAGDIIIKMNNKNVQGAVDVKNIIGDLRVGTEVNMTLLRAGRPRNITVIIAQPKTEKSAAPLRADNLQKATGQPFWEKGLR
ncbi:PDZ domain-containing protein [Thiothrix subterranea]|nr:PDZ domain-containing protein [Thiothrix subterranea]